MAQKLLSVGIDVGTTTTQVIFSHLTVENKAGAFAVPELHITKKMPIFKSPIHFTPLRDEQTIDADSLRQIVGKAYEQAQIRPDQVQTGAVIITGETARKENAETIVHALADLAGDFVVATAGPALEGILAARGAGADRLSDDIPESVIHLDIGGGTSNLSLWQNGCCISDGCWNVGGRLLRFNCNGQVTYVSPVLYAHCSLSPGDRVTEEAVRPIAQLLVTVLEEAVGIAPRTELSKSFLTNHPLQLPGGPVHLSFSGGVADLLKKETLPHWLRYEDMGVVLAKAIRESRLMQLPHSCPCEPIRATVLGAGSHATQLSGSTVFYRNFELPQHDLPVAVLSDEKDIERLPQLLCRFAAPPALFLNWQMETHFPTICALAEHLAFQLRQLPLAAIVLQQDLGKALGFALAAILKEKPLICLDSLSIPEGSFLDIGAPVGGAFPVVIKTLIFSH